MTVNIEKYSTEMKIHTFIPISLNQTKHMKKGCQAKSIIHEVRDSQRRAQEDAN